MSGVPEYVEAQGDDEYGIGEDGEKVSGPVAHL